MENLKLMTTGLVDLNGREITDGDLFVFRDDRYVRNPEDYQKEPSPDDERYRIEFDHGAFVGRKVKDSNMMPNSYDYGIIVLRDMIALKEDKYISNYGVPEVFVNNVVRGWIVED